MKNKKNKPVFSQNLIRFRKERGLTQEKLAELSGLTQRMIVYYENRAIKPPIDKIELLAKTLNVSINDLIGTTEPTEIQNQISQLDSKTLKKLKLILSLPKNERHVIYSIAENFHARKKLEEITNERYLVD